MAKRKEVGYPEWFQLMVKHRYILMVMVYVIFCLLDVGGYIVYLIGGQSLMDSMGSIVYNMGVGCTFILGVVLFNQEWSDAWVNFKRYWYLILIAIPVFYVVIVLQGFLSTTLMQGAETANQESVAESVVKGSLYGSMLLYGVILPIIEEVVYREVVIGWFKSKKLLWVGYIVSMGIFAYLHGLDSIQSLAMYIPLTIYFTLFYRLLKDNLLASSIVHIFNNLAGVVLLFIAAQ